MTEQEEFEFRLRLEREQGAPKLSATERLQMGLADPIHGGAQLLTKVLPAPVVEAGNRFNNWVADKTGMVAKLPEGGVDEQVKQREAEYQARKPKGFDWARLTGNVLSPVNLAMAAAGPSTAALGGRMAIGAGLGGASAAMAPATSGDFGSEKAQQVLGGTFFGGVVPGVVAGASRVISPKASVNPDLSLLKKEGVFPTIGQTLGGRFNALEEKMGSLPIMGDAISLARGRALKQFNEAALNRATGKIGQTVDDVGQQGVGQAANVIGQAYDDAASMVKSVRFDRQFQSDLTQLRGMARSLLPDMRRKFETKLRDVVGGRTSQANAMLPETFKKVDSEIGELARRYGASTTASEQELGQAFKQLQNLLRQQATRTNPKYAEALENANAAYANLVRVEGAAKAAKNNAGVFTPAQLNTAIQTADNSVRKRAVSQGRALMQDLGNAGQSVIGNRVPNSGTWDRAALGIGSLGAGYMEPTIPLALIAGAGAYTPPAQALLRGLVASRPAVAPSVANLFNQSAPMLAPAGGLLGIQMLNQ